MPAMRIPQIALAALLLVPQNATIRIKIGVSGNSFVVQDQSTGLTGALWLPLEGR